MIIKAVYQEGMGGANRSLRKQKKAFLQRGLPVHEFHLGTINVNSHPEKYRVLTYDHFMEEVTYRSFLHRRTEDFGFIRILSLTHNDITFSNWGYLYFAHKSPHFLNNEVFELIGPRLDGLRLNDRLVIEVADGRMERMIRP
ncbi:MAG: hypothetical protein RG741_06890 [Bacteroidales bacterium]|nr:hypothetical protein [Bacteroidales bacterium]